MASRACAYELGKFLQCQHLLLMVEFQLPPVLPHVCPSFLLPPIMADCPPPPAHAPFCLTDDCRAVSLRPAPKPKWTSDQQIFLKILFFKITCFQTSRHFWHFAKIERRRTKKRKIKNLLQTWRVQLRR